MLQQGDRLVATARNVSTLAHLTGLAAHGDDQLLITKLDVTKQEDVDEAFAKAVKQFGRVDVVVNNAGYGLFGELESLSDEQIQSQLDVNLWGVLRVTRAALKVFRENQQPIGGRLIQISSVGGFHAVPCLSVYNARYTQISRFRFRHSFLPSSLSNASCSKFAVEGLSEAVSKELNPEWNIKVTIVQPGGFSTDWSRSLTTSQPHPAYAAEGSRLCLPSLPQDRAHLD